MSEELKPAPFAPILKMTKAEHRRIGELAAPYWTDPALDRQELAADVRRVIERKLPWADVRVAHVPGPSPDEIRLGVFVDCMLDCAIWLTPQS
jgi:hypothetical protein